MSKRKRDTKKSTSEILVNALVDLIVGILLMIIQKFFDK